MCLVAQDRVPVRPALATAGRIGTFPLALAVAVHATAALQPHPVRSPGARVASNFTLAVTDAADGLLPKVAGVLRREFVALAAGGHGDGSEIGSLGWHSVEESELRLESLIESEACVVLVLLRVEVGL